MINEIFIVDDDHDIREALSVVLCTKGYRATTFSDGQSFVRRAREQAPACVLLDLCMPGLSGLDVLREIDARTYPAPIVIVSGQNDIADVVEAMKSGAFDYIEKRHDAGAIAMRVVDAIVAWTRIRHKDRAFAPAFSGQPLLTRRERDVLSQITAAASNKQAAKNLGISPRTVEIHRGHIMRKLGAKNTADLMRIVMNKE